MFFAFETIWDLDSDVNYLHWKRTSSLPSFEDIVLIVFRLLSSFDLQKMIWRGNTDTPVVVSELHSCTDTYIKRACATFLSFIPVATERTHVCQSWEDSPTFAPISETFDAIWRDCSQYPAYTFLALTSFATIEGINTFPRSSHDGSTEREGT